MRNDTWNIILPAAIALVACSNAFASSNEAWEALYAKANGTSIGKSGLDTLEASAPVVFDDTSGKIGVLLRGKASKATASTPVDLICLFEKKTGHVSISEYQWLGR